MILYDDVTMVLEAMDIDPAIGSREWVAGYHVEDAIALAEAAFWSQARRPVWTSRVAGDPFSKELARWQDELMIEPARSDWARPIQPSYFTWRPGPEYIAQKICDFYNDRERFPHSGPRRATWCVDAGNKVGSFSHERDQIRVMLGDDAGGANMLAKFPRTHAFTTPMQLKAELARHLFASLERAIPQRWTGYGPDRKPFFDAMEYVDALWGVHAAVD
jgi:hypothetical protein